MAAIIGARQKIFHHAVLHRAADYHVDHVVFFLARTLMGKHSQAVLGLVIYTNVRGRRRRRRVDERDERE